MNRKITLPKAARLMSESSGLSIRQCEDFLKALSDIVTETLIEGESIKIKGIGTFRLTRVEARKSVDIYSGEPNEIAEHIKVVFIPSKELALEVNSPFEFFEAVELDDNINEEELEILEEEKFEDESHRKNKCALTRISDLSTNSENDISHEAIFETDHESDSNGDMDTIPVMDSRTVRIENTESEDKILSQEKEEDTKSADIESDPGEEKLYPSEEKNFMERKDKFRDDRGIYPDEKYLDERETTDNSKRKKSFRFGWGFILGFIACLVTVALGMGVCLAIIWGKIGIKNLHPDNKISEVIIDINHSDNRDNEESDTITISGEKSDEINIERVSEIENEETNDVPTLPSDRSVIKTSEPVYDTISKTRFLTTMAKDHYGDFNLWPYIYEENKAILGHPDRIRPGTKVIIPPLSKYGVSNTPDEIAKAKRLGAEIYSRYR